MAERDFLKKNLTNPENLSKAYGIQIGEKAATTPTVETIKPRGDPGGKQRVWMAEIGKGEYAFVDEGGNQVGTNTFATTKVAMGLHGDQYDVQQRVIPLAEVERGRKAWAEAEIDRMHPEGTSQVLKERYDELNTHLEKEIKSAEKDLSSEEARQLVMESPGGLKFKVLKERIREFLGATTISQDIPSEQVKKIPAEHRKFANDLFRETNPEKIWSMVKDYPYIKETLDFVAAQRKKPAKKFSTSRNVEDHPKWVKNFVGERIDDPRFSSKENPEAVVIIGMPSASKSVVAKDYEKTHLLIDADEAKKASMDSDGVKDFRLAEYYHEESAHVVEKLLYESATKGKKNVIIPKVGKTIGSVRPMIEDLHAKGYRVKLAYLSLSPAEALKRSIVRFLGKGKGLDHGRFVPPDYVIGDVGNLPIKKVYDILKSEVEEYVSYDVSKPFGVSAERIDQGTKPGAYGTRTALQSKERIPTGEIGTNEEVAGSGGSVGGDVRGGTDSVYRGGSKDPLEEVAATKDNTQRFIERILNQVITPEEKPAEGPGAPTTDEAMAQAPKLPAKTTKPEGSEIAKSNLSEKLNLQIAKSAEEKGISAARTKDAISSILSNDEVSTDKELVDHFQEEFGFSQDVAEFIVSKRNKVLTLPLGVKKEEISKEEIERVAKNILKNNNDVTETDSKAVEKDVISNREMEEYKQEFSLSKESGQMNVDQIPGVVEVAEGLLRAHDEFHRSMSPYSIGEGKVAAASMRENLGKMARSADILEKANRQARDFFSRASDQSNLDFIDKMERGQPQATPELQKIADNLRSTLDAKRDEIRALGTGKLEQFIADYFPHIWKQPNTGNAIQRIFGKRPLQGPKSFLKKRTIEFTSDGVGAGLEPISYNPIDLVRTKIREMDRYLMAHRTINELKDNGLVKFVKVGDKAPDGFIRINDSISQVFSKGENGELIMRGNYFAQENAARIINNYLSPGLHGRFLYDAYRGAGNVLNQFQLGFSAFHLGFTSMDATVSKFALGLNKLAVGNFLGGLKEMGSSPAAPITNIMQGDKLMKAWYGQSKDPRARIIADVMAIAGGRARMDQFYATHFSNRVKEAIKQHKFIKAALQVPWAAIEMTSKPIMEYLVPRQKLGVFFDLIKMELELRPNMTHEELRAISQKAWDSVDNRMGQLVYDNLFWNKVTKDLAMASVRSVGWNLGTIREVGGGVYDLAKTAANAVRGKNPELSYRSSYLIALPIVAGIYGAIYQYLRTGKGPEELKDYYFPKNGALDRNGDPARDSLPTYMKDLYHYYQAPGKTIMNKLAPQNAIIAQMLANKDFYGTEIRNVDENPVKQILEVMKYGAIQATPFGIRNVQKANKKDTAAKILPFVGIVPAPYDVNATPAERVAYEISQGKRAIGSRTQAQAEKSKLKADLRNDYKETGSLENMEKARSEGKISSDEFRSIKDAAKEDPLVRSTKSFSVYEMARVIKKANDKEKKVLIKIFKEKYNNKFSDSSADEKIELKKKWDEVMGGK